MVKKYNILIIDDHAIFRAGLRQLLQEELPVQHIVEVGTAAGALKRINEFEFDILLLDINLPDRNGIELLKSIKQANLRLPILMLSMYSEEQYAIRAIRAGASGYLTKDASPDALISAIKDVAEGGKYISQTLAHEIAAHIQGGNTDLPHTLLSDREYDIFIKLSSGKTVSEIAEQILLSVKTVSTYRARILKKMNMKTNAELMHYAVKQQLV